MKQESRHFPLILKAGISHAHGSPTLPRPFSFLKIHVRKLSSRAAVFLIKSPEREIVRAAAKGTTADFQSRRTTGFRSGRSQRRDANTIAKWQASIWTCCQGRKQKGTPPLFRGRRETRCQEPLLQITMAADGHVRDHWTPVVPVSFRGARGGRQAPLRPAGRPSAPSDPSPPTPSVYSNHRCSKDNERRALDD